WGHRRHQNGDAGAAWPGIDSGPRADRNAGGQESPVGGSRALTNHPAHPVRGGTVYRSRSPNYVLGFSAAGVGGTRFVADPPPAPLKDQSASFGTLKLLPFELFRIHEGRSDTSAITL